MYYLFQILAIFLAVFLDSIFNGIIENGDKIFESNVSDILSALFTISISFIFILVVFYFAVFFSKLTKKKYFLIFFVAFISALYFYIYSFYTQIGGLGSANALVENGTITKYGYYHMAKDIVSISIFIFFTNSIFEKLWRSL